MANSPFEKLYEPIKNTAAYLERIGYKDAPEVSLVCLKKLVLGQLHNIPFEDLDVFHGHKEPSLDTDALFEKIVVNKRGGYCFELNGLFARLLTTLGFACRSHMARVVWNYPPADTAFSSSEHRNVRRKRLLLRCGLRRTDPLLSPANLL